MEVPFISSGAMSRTHYSVVRKVENAPSAQAADQLLLREIESVRRRLADPRLHVKECQECLILLLYCSMALVVASPGDLDFALPHAVNLAETGQSTQSKRIGYLFCAEVMSPSHELQLMLINTLRKDLESSHIPRICLALDALIQSSTEDVIPAVQSRLHDLLSHSSPHVRRRALLVFRVLSRYDAEILARIEGKVIKRIKDSDFSVSHAALIVSTHFKRSDKVHAAISDMLASAWTAGEHKSKRRMLLALLEAFRVTRPSPDSIHTTFEIIRYASEYAKAPLLREAFLVLSSIPCESISSAQTKLALSPVDSIRYLLASTDPNQQYLFITCLGCLDQTLWAGTLPDTVAILDEWEAERVMKLLDSSDSLIRKNASILRKFSICGLLQRMPSALSIRDRDEYVSRLLEIGEIQCGGDGELYAVQLRELLADVDTKAESLPEGQPIIESAVERILVHVRSMDISGRIGCVTTLISPIVESESRIGSTLMVIISALVCEYAGKTSISPVAILRGISSRLSLYAAAVQDACLLSMLRLCAECSQVPDDVIVSTKDILQLSRRHITRRCEQFLNLSSQRHVLTEIISKAHSSSLPDFVASLSEYQSTDSHPEIGRVVKPTPSGLSSLRSTGASSKLRYTAYETPQPTPSLRHLTSPRIAPTSPHTVTHSDLQGRHRSLSQASDVSSSFGPLARTMTPGELTLATSDNGLDRLTQTGDTRRPSPGTITRQSGSDVNMEISSALDDLASGVNLISLEAPFISELMVSTEPDFQGCWEGMGDHSGRGWCEASMDTIVRRLQQLQHRLKVIAIDQPPYEGSSICFRLIIRFSNVCFLLAGDLKVLVQAASQVDSYRCAALRLRESDDESCLWRMRCEDDELRTSIKRLLDEI
ncbi:hypothetical protein SERLADRAFT_437300 [Serpula lacrymans var. lacrymans S7.9]|uniref:Clathrin/coatomer adaptor adaptin-like N-terminal domain-containing protein n=1 Tax=Serpula lacrymans var. lacrymans (strain S7.9) TaxID=578457 RepID=F8NTA0_SERL9|nr:uncharacterized protein SERLADRAFT_437300 [Serpula lacrymans var. lacrymans S7.9]EGO25573.1 hypothetical protein SERLADRAFT_437300 [Serpula lacrymans var. lacrymans S7.9]